MKCFINTFPKNTLKSVIIVFVLTLVVISLFFNKEIKDRQKSITNIKHRIDEEFIYDSKTKRYVNAKNGIWYIIKNGYKVIPAEEYLKPEIAKTLKDINIENRPNNVWKLEKLINIEIKNGDALSQIITKYSINHFRIDRKWYSEQVLKLNGIINPNSIYTGQFIKITIYIDSGK